ncbi:MAG: AAA family ATPase [Gammaproteobacteria bacterium]|nr:AAA family ATPase [Gammaproteobacteria bacterium]
MILLIGGEKGGTGKSTIATNLAVFLALRGVDVMLLDADPQGTASKWVERRNGAEAAAVHCAQKTGDVYATAMDLAKRYQVVIIDAGGRDSRELRTAMVAADRMIIPLKASQADLETLPHLDEVVGLAKGMNPSLVATAILSMAPTNPIINEVAEARDLLVQFEEIGLANGVVRERKIYRDAMYAGRGVVEMGNGKAKAEIQLLAQELFPGL